LAFIAVFSPERRDGLLIPENDITLQPGHTYLVIVESIQQDQRPEVDALAEIAALAQPIGPIDLDRHFDLYSERVLLNETSEHCIDRRSEF
jgi:hypothetical protein